MSLTQQVLEGKYIYLEFAGNLIPVTKSGEQLSVNFVAFRENRLPFTVRLRDPDDKPVARLLFMSQPKVCLLFLCCIYLLLYMSNINNRYYLHK